MEPTAEDLLKDDPKFKDYLQAKAPQTAPPPQPAAQPARVQSFKPITAADYSPSLTPAGVENPLAEYGVPPPGSDIKPTKNAIYFHYGSYILLGIIGLLILFVVFRLISF